MDFLNDKVESVRDFLNRKIYGKKKDEPTRSSGGGSFSSPVSKPKKDLFRDDSALGIAKNTILGIPEAGKKRTRQIADFLQPTGQAFNRGFGAAANTINKTVATLSGKGDEYQPFTPSTPFQKELYGTDKPLTFSGVGRETRFGNFEGESRGIFKGIDPLIGLGIVGADLFSGGKASQGVRALSKLDKEVDILKQAKKFFNIDLADDAVRAISKTKDEKKIGEILSKETDRLKGADDDLIFQGVGKDSQSDFLTTNIEEARGYANQPGLKGNGEIKVYKYSDLPDEMKIITKDDQIYDVVKRDLGDDFVDRPLSKIEYEKVRTEIGFNKDEISKLPLVGTLKPGQNISDLKTGVSSLSRGVSEAPTSKTKIQNKIAELDYRQSMVDEAIKSSPGAKLMKYMSRKEDEFLDFVNPLKVTDPKKAAQITARNKRVFEVMENAGYDNFDDPDLIRKVLDDYKNLKAETKLIKEEKKGLMNAFKNTKQLPDETSSLERTAGEAMGGEVTPPLKGMGTQQKIADEFGVVKERSLPKGAAQSGRLTDKVRDIKGQKAADAGELNPELYKTLSNKAVMSKAAEDVAKDPQAMRDFVMREVDVGDLTYQNAVGIKLIEAYDNQALGLPKKEAEKLYEKAADVWNLLDRRATSAGQSAQILSTVSEQSPTVRRVFVEKYLDDLNGALEPRFKKVKLSTDDYKKISDFYDKADIAKTPEMKAFHVQQAKQIVLNKFRNLYPKRVIALSKLKKFRYISMLLNPKTWVRNVIGNKSFARLEQVGNYFASPVDIILKNVYKTGVRTVGAVDWSVYKKGYKKGKKLANMEIEAGLDMSKADKFKKDYPNIKFSSKVMNALDRLTQKSLRVPDRGAFYGTFDSELASIMKNNKVTEADDWMIDIASQAAEYRTFQDGSGVAKTFEGLRSNLNKASTYMLGIDQQYTSQVIGLGDLILPFVRTPFNLLARGLAYSPAGFIGGTAKIRHLTDLNNQLKTVKKLQPKNVFKIRTLNSELAKLQRETATALTRAAVGTGAIVAPSYFLAKNGVITDQYDIKEAAVEGAKREVGSGPMKVNTSAITRFLTTGGADGWNLYQDGDKMVSYDWLQPAAVPISMGVIMAKAEDKGLLNKLLEVPISSMEVLEEQPMLQTIKDLFGGGGYDSGVVDGMVEVFKGVPSSFVPTFFNQLRQLKDPQRRQVDDSSIDSYVLDSMMNRVPFLSETLAPRVSGFGTLETNIQNQNEQNFLFNAFNVFLNPAFISEFTTKDKEIITMLELFGATGKQKFPKYVLNKDTVKIRKGGEEVEVKLEPEQKALMQRYIGLTSRALTLEMVSNKNFSNMDSFDQSDELGDIMNDVYNAALMIYLEEEPSKRTKKRVLSLYNEYQAIKNQKKNYISELEGRYNIEF